MPLPNEIIQSLPEELRGNESLNRFNSVEDLARSFVETKAMVGQSIRIPPEEASTEVKQEFIEKLMRNAPNLTIKPNPEEPEQMEEFYRVMGKPADFAEYQNPEDVKINPDVESELRTILHGANITNAQYQKIIAEFAAREAQANDTNQKALDEASNELKAKWGQTYDERLQAARKANEEFYPGRDFDTLTPGELEGLHNVAKAVTSGKPHAAGQPESSGKLPPEEALRRANEIMQNPEYWDQSNPNQANLINKRLDYLRMAGMTDDTSNMRARTFEG